jgi:hypothetical protein
MSLAQAADSRISIEAAARCYLWPIHEVAREVKLLFGTGTSSPAWQTERFTSDFGDCSEGLNAMSRSR